MSFKSTREGLAKDLEVIKANGLWKTERHINSDQKSAITLADGSEVINMCANNYLGLANNPQVIESAKQGLDRWGFGLTPSIMEAWFNSSDITASSLVRMDSNNPPLASKHAA